MFNSIPKTLLLAMCVATPVLAAGATRSPEEAQAVAADFFKAHSISRLAHKDALTLVQVVNNGSLSPVSYVFNANDGKGFVIVSAETEAIPVIGYSDTNIWDLGAVPELTQTLLSESVFESYTPLRGATRAEEGEKLLETPAWSQEAPFNNNIPNRRLTGCVGVALAEIMKYHNTPAARPDALSGSDGVAYAWDAMRLDNYRSGYSAEEADAVATLVADAAIGIGTDFGMSSSSAFEVKVPYALTSMFGYDAGVSYKKLSEISQNEWVEILINEIAEDRPVLFSGQDVSAGHAFVCDGYKTDANGSTMLHFNWGWGGAANGYFAPGALNPVVSKKHSYNQLQTIVYNIKPAANDIKWSPVHLTNDENQPGLTLDVVDITTAPSFTVRAGTLKNISTSDFSGQLSIALFDEAGKQKALLNDGRNFSLIALQTVKYVDFTGKLPAGTSVAAGDVVRLVTKAAGDDAWQPVAGDLLVMGEARAVNGTLPCFAIEFPEESEAYTVSADASQVIKGRDYTFKVVNNDAQNIVTVKANGVIITPDASNIYRITNVLADQTITVNVQNAADVLSKSVLWLEAGNLKNLLDDNATSTVKELTLFGTMNAEDFTFIREKMKINYLDISQVSITASGSNPANAIPTKVFNGYRSLQKIILPKSLTTLKNGCFAQTGLTSIEIPANVSNIEYNIFVGCGALREVISRRATPAWVNWCVFSGVPQKSGTLIVPPGSTAAYQAKEYWRDFGNIVEQAEEAPTTVMANIADTKGVTFTSLTEGTEFEPGSVYTFKMETDNSVGDAIVSVYANTTRLYPNANGEYTHQLKANTLFHADLRQPEPTTPDNTWKFTGDGGGVGLVTTVVNVPINQSFTVRANAIKVPTGAESNKFFGMVLTDKDGAIKEFISPIYTNTSMNTGNVTMDFSCKVTEASVKEGNELRLATSYNKKIWNLVGSEADSISDRCSAVNNRVVYHTVTMPQTIDGAKIEGAATEIVRGMPFNLKVTPTSPSQRATVAVNGINKAVSAAIANVSIPAVTEDLDIAIQINDAGAEDYVVVNVQENQLAAKIAECPDRLKLIGTILAYEFDAFRAHAGNIVDLDLSDLTIKGAMMTGNAIPENAFAPTAAGGTSALRTIILPKNLERISNNAFARCLQLSEITIPKTVNYVGTGAFSQCVALKSITMEGTTPPLTGNMTPFPANASAITLHVPFNYEFEYQNATFWNTLTLYKVEDPKEYYWCKYDPSRFTLWWASTGDTNNIGVGYSENSKTEEVWLVLPNNQRPNSVGGNNDQLRLGVPFRLYDNGFDVVTDLINYETTKSPYNYQDVMNGYTRAGGVFKLKWIPNETNAFYKPQNHELNLVFYYPVVFQNEGGADGVKASFVNLQREQEWKNADLGLFNYSLDEYRDVYREGMDLQFKLTPPSPNMTLDVKIVQRVMTQSGKSPKYETTETEVSPNVDGIYTIPALAGDVWVKYTGHMEIVEGEPVKAEDLAAAQKEQVEEFKELAVTGEVTEEGFQAVRENFESIETLDLSGIANTVLPEGAFEGLENLRNVIVSANVTEIGADAFKGCENLESVVIPGVSVIGEGAFDGCSNLTSILLPAAGAEAATRAEAEGITAESFRGLNPNCLIYLNDTNIPDSDHLNIILNENGTRVAASDIAIDSNYPFNAPASFNLGSHRISLTAHIPGSDEAGIDGGWTGFMLPFTPTGWEYGVEFGERPGSGLTILSFDGEEAETLTAQDKVEAYRPYLAHVVAPFASVPVTFYATTNANDSIYDLQYSPMPDELVARGKEFALYGSLDGETVLGKHLAMDENASKFLAADSVKIGAFGAYLVANGDSNELAIGKHAVWVNEPAGAGVSGTSLYRGDKVELGVSTRGASIYYTLDGSDPSDKENAARTLYTGALNLEHDSLELNAVAEYDEYSSEVVDLEFHLKKVDIDYALAQNWNWISHNMENEVAVADFAVDGVSRVIAQTQEAVRDPKLGIVGNLKTLAPAVGYKVFASSKDAKANIKGVAFNPTATVVLHAGWNWIGCPVDDASLLVSDLLASLEAEEGDMIVGLEGFQQADAEGNWTGTLPALAPGAGYLYYSQSDKEFTYTFVHDTEAQAADEAATRSLADTPWVVDIHRYANVMPVTATALDADGFDMDEVKVAAFCGAECRGIGKQVGDVIMINIHGNAGDIITFRYIDGNDNEFISSAEVEFREMPLGTISEPYALRLNPLSSVNGIEAEGLEIVSENGAIVVKGNLSGNASVEVYDLAGNRLGVASASNGTVAVKGLEPGVRIIVVRTGSDVIYQKVMVK